MQPWQKRLLLELGHGKALAMDATFGTNKYKVTCNAGLNVKYSNMPTSTGCDACHNSYVQYQLFTIMVFDEFQNGIPVCWVLAAGATGAEIAEWLCAMRDSLRCEHCLHHCMLL